MAVSSRDFWHDAYQLRSLASGAGSDTCGGCPAFMRSCADSVMMAGKVRILLRFLQPQVTPAPLVCLSTTASN